MPKRIRLCWVCGLLAAAMLERGDAEPTNYHVEVWQTDQGLPQNTVTAIAQTRDGYLWVGTQNGLARFDGVRFSVFDENNTPAIQNSRIVQLFQDPKDSLWIGTEQGRLVRLRDGEFSSYVPPSKGTTLNFARSFCSDVKDDLWMVTCEWQLIHFAKGKFSVPSAGWNLSGAKANIAVEDTKGQVWVGTENELAVWRDGVFRSVWSRTNEQNFQVDFLAASQSGGCWVAANGRLRKFDAGKWVADLGPYAWTNHPIYSMFEDQHHQLWVGTLGSGLFRYDTNGAVLHLTTKEGLPTDFVRCVMEDREGNIWVGTEGAGLCRLKPAVFRTFGTRQGLSSDQVMSVCESKDGGLWIGSNGDGLDYYKDGRVEHYGPQQGLKNGHVWSVLEDHQGALWVVLGGLFKGGRGGFTSYSDGKNIGWLVLAEYEDPRDRLWLGQQAFGALTELYQDQPTVIKIPGAAESLDVRTMVEDHDGNLWVGTNGEGLYRFHDGKWTRFQKKDGLGSDAIWCLYVDKEGALWVGTCRGGLSRWHDGRFTTWTSKDGLINNVICQILEDSRGNLWLGSYGGVFRVSKAALDNYTPAKENSLPCIGYGKEQGLPSMQCQGGFQPSGYKASDGKLWFPTVKGFAIVDPETIVPNSLAPPVVIEDVLVDDEEVTTGQQAPSPPTPSMGSATSAPPATLKIPPGDQGLEVHYTALSFTAPDEVHFKYRMEGLDKDWQKANTRRMAHYSHLPPGSYRFQVIACNNDGVWNETGATLAVLKLPYFWETKWFFGLSAFAALALAAGIARNMATRKLERRLELAEHASAIERERARIAKDIHDDLGAKLTEIVFLSDLARNPEAPLNEIHADINKITSKARELTKSLDEIVWAVNPQNDTLDNFVTYACNYAQKYICLANISCRFAVPEQLPDVLLTTDVRHNLFLILKEALNNVIKHAAASEVWIYVSLALESNLLTMTIQDNGRGFESNSIEGGATTLSKQTGGRGVMRSGLTNMRKRIEHLGGRFELQSQPNQGTSVRVTICLRRE